MSECPKCGRRKDSGECMYCWGLEAGADYHAGKRDVRIPNTNLRRNVDTGAVSNPNSGCVVLAVLALSGLIPSVLLALQVLI
ncbi:hypothetical protein [Micromonospora sp. NBRC 101691]|uniref:hypothetical protein n=1 Tax=Micromonospora sp. NBRC 101691 TaxID=3032198 RepID=UPI0024A37B67|nr:hypothetical protein [Micromonospora sp. NBRC 101691]GLY26423.1 hypothetical protein Misp04_61540 [Micromonospora sp. NBRC 101691]